jgi:hypothetical protein
VFKKSIVCRHINTINGDDIINIKYCFPDLAVYLQNIIAIQSTSDISEFNIIPDIIIYGKKDRSVLGFIDIQEVLPELERLINYLSTEDYSMDDSSEKKNSNIQRHAK